MYLKVDQILKILPYKYNIYFCILDKQDNTFRLCLIPIKYYKKKKKFNKMTFSYLIYHENYKRKLNIIEINK